MHRLAVVVILFGSVHMVRADRTPQVVRDVLKNADRIELISLDPGLLMPGAQQTQLGRFRGWPVLGRTFVSDLGARTELVDALARGLNEHDGGVGGCFSPAHGVTAQWKDRRLEIVICFGCHHFHAFVNGEFIAGADGISESPMVELDRLLVEQGVPIGWRPDPEKQEAERRARMLQAMAEQRRWVAGMPEVLRPMWEANSTEIRRYGVRDVDPWKRRLVDAHPDPQDRIRALLRWYGSGAGPWSGFPAYESFAGGLLLDYPTPVLLDAIAVAPLAPEQVEGAARLLAGWHFRRDRPQDLALIPAELKRRLLEHALASSDEDKRGRARRAFGN